MCIAINHRLKYSSLREERNRFSASRCANLLRSYGARTNSVTSGYKHPAPLGRNRTASTCCSSKLNSLRFCTKVNKPSRSGCITL
jgi:hypothetical protein